MMKTEHQNNVKAFAEGVMAAYGADEKATFEDAVAHAERMTRDYMDNATMEAGAKLARRWLAGEREARA